MVWQHELQLHLRRLERHSVLQPPEDLLVVVVDREGLSEPQVEVVGPSLRGVGDDEATGACVEAVQTPPILGKDLVLAERESAGSRSGGVFAVSQCVDQVGALRHEPGVGLGSKVAGRKEALDRRRAQVACAALRDGRRRRPRQRRRAAVGEWDCGQVGIRVRSQRPWSLELVRDLREIVVLNALPPGSAVVRPCFLRAGGAEEQAVIGV